MDYARKKVGFVGLGKLGLPCAEVMSKHHYVEGYDINPVVPENVKMVESLSALCCEKDLIFIAVPTPHDPIYGGETPSAHLPPMNFDYSAVKSILQEMNNYLDEQQLVVLISTVLPGTIRKELLNLIENFRFIYNPYLIAM